MKIVLTAAALALALSGAAYAQSGSGASSSGNSSSATTTPMQAQEEGGMQYKSDAEKMMWEKNSSMMAPFFTDNSMKTMKSDADVKAAFAAMDADNQKEMKTACEKAMEDRASYGNVTTSLCTQVMAN